MDYGWGGVTDLAKKIGKSEEFVSHRLQLLRLSDDIKEKISINNLNVSKAIEITTIPEERQCEIVEQIINNNLSVRKIREIKTDLKERQEFEFNYDNKEFNHIAKSLKITKKASLSLKISLARIDNLIEEVQENIEPGSRTEIINFLMGIRLKIHDLIDETIKFKNQKKKSIN